MELKDLMERMNQIVTRVLKIEDKLDAAEKREECIFHAVRGVEERMPRRRTEVRIWCGDCGEFHVMERDNAYHADVYVDKHKRIVSVRETKFGIECPKCGDAFRRTPSIWKCFKCGFCVTGEEVSKFDRKAALQGITGEWE